MPRPVFQIQYSEDSYTNIRDSLIELNAIFRINESRAETQSRRYLSPTCSPAFTRSNSQNTTDYFILDESEEKILKLLKCIKTEVKSIFENQRDDTSQKLRGKMKEIKEKINRNRSRDGSRSPMPFLDPGNVKPDPNKVSLECSIGTWSWERPDHNTLWSCSIVDHWVDQSTNSPHVEYDIETVMLKSLMEKYTDAATDTPIKVHHRFQDFKDLYKGLSHSLSPILIPRLPVNHANKCSEKLTLYRTQRLKYWLQYCSDHPVLCQVKLIHVFLLNSGQEWRKKLEPGDFYRHNIWLYVNPSQDVGFYNTKFNLGRNIRHALRSLRESVTEEKEVFSEGLQKCYEKFHQSLVNLASECQTHVLASSLSKVAEMFEKRALHFSNKIEHFDELDNVLEEFSIMLKRVKSTADDSGGGVGKEGSEMAVSRASLAPIAEAEYHWASKHIYTLLAIGLSGYCKAHAEFLQEDVGLCRQITDTFVQQI